MKSKNWVHIFCANLTLEVGLCVHHFVVLEPQPVLLSVPHLFAISIAGDVMKQNGKSRRDR